MIQISNSEPKFNIEYLQKRTQVEVKNLTGMPFGDYCWLVGADSEVLERKYITDFVSSLISKRLTEQLRGCLEEFKRVFLAIEGIWDEVDGKLVVYRKTEEGFYVPAYFSPNIKYEDVWSAIKTFLASVDIIFTPNRETTVQVVLNLSKGIKENNLLTRAVKRKKMPVWTRDRRVIKLMNLVDRLPEQEAKELINKFGSIKGIMAADDGELMLVEGIGKGLIRNIRSSVG